MNQIVKILVFLLVVSSLSSCGYNNMVTLDEGVSTAWAQVETAYQRRADLIMNVVKSVERAGQVEKDILTEVIEARSKATSVEVNIDNMTPENIKKFESMQSGFSGAISRLLATFERYPELKSISGYKDLTMELERTENRIAVERNRFNEEVQKYNTYIRKIPQNITSTIFGFSKKGYFESNDGAENAPQLDFGGNVSGGSGGNAVPGKAGSN